MRSQLTAGDNPSYLNCYVPFYDVETYLQEDDLSLPEADLIDSEAHRAAMLFAEMEKSDNARNWRSKLPNDPEARRRLAQLDFLCTIMQTTTDKLRVEMKKGLNEVDGVKMRKTNRKEIESSEEKLKKCKLKLKESRVKLKNVVQELKTADTYSDRFEALQSNQEVLLRHIAGFRNEKKGLDATLAQYRLPNVKDPRTLQGFLRGENKQPGKLKALRDKFLNQLPTGHWLCPHIDSFFQAVSLQWAREGEPGNSAE